MTSVRMVTIGHQLWFTSALTALSTFCVKGLSLVKQLISDYVIILKTAIPGTPAVVSRIQQLKETSGTC